MDVTQRAQRAKALLDDPLFKEAFDVLQDAQIRVFTSDVCSPEQLTEAHRMVRALNALRDQIASIVIDGKMFEHRKEKGQHRV
jgi:spermidine synthase